MTDNAADQRVQRVVVIGAGQAAAQLVTSLRASGFAGRSPSSVTSRFCPISGRRCRRNFSSERPAPESLYPRPAQFWSERNVQFLLGIAAAKADLRNRNVTLADGREVPFDTLVFATGTCARRLPLPGVDLDGVFSLRAIGDVQRCARHSMRRSTSPFSAAAISGLKPRP